jgi:O-antigen ligase
LAVVLVLVVALMPDEQRRRFTHVGDDYTSRTRLQYWHDGVAIANRNPLLGIGYGNWLTYYIENYNSAGQLPHNIFVQCMAELGYAGLIAFVALITTTLVINHRTRRLSRRLSERGRFPLMVAHGLDAAMLGYLGSGFFVTVLYYPYFWINFALTVSLNVATIRAVRDTARHPGGAIPTLPSRRADAARLSTSPTTPQ